jgi:general secretion pathway protein A
MDYFSIVNLNKEPFSNSPDPEFFYGSRQHLDCLQKLELALRLRRGLNVVIGDVGTGKTTLCRQLIRRFAEAEDYETHLILDPHFTNSTEFLMTVAKMFKGRKPAPTTNDWQLKELIKQYLFLQGVDRNKTVVLIIDEGQKLPVYCLELLREFLNYETNEYKLLQIVIFAQKEFQNVIKDYANFADRINLYHFLRPMTFRDSRAMIRYRLEKSSNDYKTYSFFSFAALLAIYLATRGYPRKIINLCHRCILTMIIQNRSSVDLFLVRTCIRRVFPDRSRRSKRIAVVAGVPLVLLAALLSLTAFGYLQMPEFRRFPSPVPVPAHKVSAVPQPPATPPPTLSVSEAADPRDAGTAATPEPPPAIAAVVSQPPAAVPSPVAPAETSTGYAPVLGRLTIEPNETFSGLIQSVYGDYNARYFKDLILANPQVEDPDLIKVGQAIVLPSIPAAVDPDPPASWWIRVGEIKTLEAAYNTLRSLPRDAPAIRMIPYWHPQAGMNFALLVNRRFSSRAQALRRLKQLPPPYTEKSDILTGWPENTVFFSDPYFGRIRTKD